MTKVTLSDLANLSNEASVVDIINDNNALIEAAIENTLSRDGTSPNPMEADLDLNSYRIYNLVAAINATEPVRKAEFDALEDVVDSVYTDTLTLYNTFSTKYLGAFSGDPTEDNEGNALASGALYFDTSAARMKVFGGGVWSVVGANWTTGSGVPDDGNGENGDLYLRSNGDVYSKADDTWGASVFSVKGATGTPGSSVTILGTFANSGLLPVSGALGDGYLITGDLWTWTGAEWENVGAIQGPQGSAGAAGNNGSNGAAGDAGADGSDGSKWYSGAGAPNNIDYVLGDWYLDTDTEDVYEKTGASEWTLRTNIKGATGATGSAGSNGSNGADGADGADGKTWYSDNGVPDTGVGVVGDYYLDLDDSDIYEKTDVATWTSIGSFKGVTGDTGSTGATGDDGADGRPAGVKYLFDSTVSKVDPGTGAVRFNSATASSVSEIYIDNTDADSNSVTAWLDAFDDSTTTANRGTLFYRANNSGTIGIYQVNGGVVDETGYRTIPVAYVAGTLPANADPIYFVFNRTGNVGAAGAGTGDMDKATYDPNDDGKVTNAVNADIVPWSGVSSKPTTLSGFGITDGQPLDDELTALAGLTSAADKVPYFTGAGTAGVADFTAAGRALLDDADASAQRTTLGLGALAVKSTIVTADIDADVVTYAKIQNVSATDKILGRSTAGAGDIEEITCTAAGRAILDDADATAQLATLGATLASTTEVLTGTATNRTVTPDALAALWEKAADVASAGTISLGEGGYFVITGTTTITDIDFATDKTGRTAWVRFSGALTLTHNATTLILPGGANITTAAGDTACFVSEGSDVVRCLSYNKASGLPVVSAASGGMTLLGTITTTSGNDQSLSGLTLTDYKLLVLVFKGVSHSSASSRSLSLGTSSSDDITITPSVSSGVLLYGLLTVDLTSGSLSGTLSTATTGANQITITATAIAGDTPITTASTAVYVALGQDNFDAGSILVYGVK